MKQLFLCAALLLAVSVTTVAAWTAAAPPAHATLVGDRAKALQQVQQAQPTLWQGAVIYVREQQQRFYRALAKSVKAFKNDRSLEAAWGLVLLSFAYGIFHAAGPGHGKAVISAYLLANERQVKRGIVLALLSSLVQALTAIALVVVVVFLLEAASRKAQSSVGYLESASYALIAVIGLYMLWRALFPNGLRQHSHAHAHGHGHAHDHHHRHEGSCGHTHIPGPELAGRATSWREALSIVFAVGLRPCSGAVLVLLFANAIGIFAAGIGATFAMSVGTAITVTALALLTLLAKNVAAGLLGRRATWLAAGLRVMSVVGALLVFLIGAVLFAGSLGPARPFV